MGEEFEIDLVMHLSIMKLKENDEMKSILLLKYMKNADLNHGGLTTEIIETIQKRLTIIIRNSSFCNSR